MEVKKMKIASSSIAMDSRHTQIDLQYKSETMKFWVGDEPNPEGTGTPKDVLEISEAAKEMKKKLGEVSQAESEDYLDEALSEKDETKIRLLEMLLEQFLGKKIKIRVPKQIKISEAQNGISLPNGSLQQRAGWGLIYDRHELRYESEQLDFAAQGSVKTADGREIDLNLQLSMSREFVSQTDIRIRAGDAVKIDPLVINFNAPAARLTDTKFSFDIDVDGKADQIFFLNPGSGFLSLDLNQDGKINDGSELFGPQSGNGFNDLAEYDQDKNGWIDENDAVFDRLRIWSKDEYGNDYLFALGQKGIGAIYLGSASTEFSLNGSGNRQNGALQRTGVFLRENGSAGTVQHVDLTI